jgi:uncharacterized protein (UPF0332 family)
MTDMETLMTYRLKQAEETIQDAEAMLKIRISSRSIVNRAYYAMFYAVLALFLNDKNFNPTVIGSLQIVFSCLSDAL